MSESPLTSDDLPNEERDQSSAEETGPRAEQAEAAEVADEVEAQESDTSKDQTPELDPIEEFKAELRLLPGEWYVVHTYAGYENRVKANLENRTQSLNMEDYIFQVEVPTQEVTEVKSGKRQQVTEKVLPGYVLVRMELTDESWAPSGTRLASPVSWVCRTALSR